MPLFEKWALTTKGSLRNSRYADGGTLARAGVLVWTAVSIAIFAPNVLALARTQTDTRPGSVKEQRNQNRTLTTTDMSIRLSLVTGCQVLALIHSPDSLNQLRHGLRLTSTRS